MSKDTATQTKAPAPLAETATIPQTIELEIGGLKVTLPVKFSTGHVLTETQAAVLDAAYQRQFSNNQNANAKSRQEKFAKATTDAERASFAPLTADQLATLYATYEPAVGGTPRGSSLERMRLEAANRAWSGTIAAHNKIVQAGGEGHAMFVGGKGKGKVLSAFPFRAIETGETKEAYGKAKLEQKETFLASVLSSPRWADLVQASLDAIQAEAEAKKNKVPTAAAETIGVDDLI